MGYQLRRDLREALGPDITGLQRAVALEIADDANEQTRESWAKLEDLARWTGAKDAVVVRNALKRLAAAGWELRVQIGKGKDGRALFAVPGTRMTFRVPLFEGVAVATPKGEQGLPQGGAGATPSTPQGVAGAHSGVAVATHRGSGGSPLLLNNPSTPHEEEDSSSPAAPDALSEADLKEFGNFWLLYPKSIDRPATLAAWKAAVSSGADPQKITAAAVAYAKQRAGEPAKFTKYSANWLRDGRYDDDFAPEPNGKPDLKAVGGKGHQPFQQTTKPSAYANGF